jgi:hypothetical protein
MAAANRLWLHYATCLASKNEASLKEAGSAES